MHAPHDFSRHFSLHVSHAHAPTAPRAAPTLPGPDSPPNPQELTFDVILGALGTLTALTAWSDFKHGGVRNEASGTLAKEATVTSSEMLEHVFYQALNLAHVLFLHLVGTVGTPTPAPTLGTLGSRVEALSPSHAGLARLILLFLVTVPWHVRSRFPVNPFSTNYTKAAAPGGALVKTLYRVKKAQYLLYKHCLLHGLNVSVALEGGQALPATRPFRTYWWCLNTAYVMEFFLQVPKRHVPKRHVPKRDVKRVALQAWGFGFELGAAS